jgi:NADH-quinone oxidoreductase subunit L
MLMLVTADNLVQLFFGWEGVGLASYLLIGFWYEKPVGQCRGDQGLRRQPRRRFRLRARHLRGLHAVRLDPISTDGLRRRAGPCRQDHRLLRLARRRADVICLLLFIGAMGKSAQFLLHTWLPDAMEGPTPVSALIHAATMVTAGVFMVARCRRCSNTRPTRWPFVTFIGATTALFAATVGWCRTTSSASSPIRPVRSSATCSSPPASAPIRPAMFHLFTHAFFKALLFLGAGSVIHAMHHEQDMRKMGGLWRKIPFTYAVMWIGTLALAGIPLLRRLFSKDAIIEAAYRRGTIRGALRLPG